MAMPIDADGRLPDWFAAEAYRSEGAIPGWHFRCGVRCRDGDLKLLDIPVVQIQSPGRSLRIQLTKRNLLEQLQTHVAMELAKLSLQE